MNYFFTFDILFFTILIQKIFCWNLTVWWCAQLNIDVMFILILVLCKSWKKWSFTFPFKVIEERPLKYTLSPSQPLKFENWKIIFFQILLYVEHYFWKICLHTSTKIVSFQNEIIFNGLEYVSTQLTCLLISFKFFFIRKKITR